MVKHTQTIRRQFADELFACVWPFCGIGAYRVNGYIVDINLTFGNGSFPNNVISSVRKTWKNHVQINWYFHER